MTNTDTHVTLPFTTFTVYVREALEACRDGYLVELAASPLATSTLVEACFLAGEPITPNVRGLALRAVLRWAIDECRPGDPSTNRLADPVWRTYNLLHQLYFEDARVSELAGPMALTEKRIYDLRPPALTTVAQVLRQALTEPQSVDGCRNAYLAARYGAFGVLAQRALRLLAVFRHPVPLALLEQLLQATAPGRAASDPAPVSQLVNAGWVRGNDDHTQLWAHPQTRPYLVKLLTATEQRLAHTQAAIYYTERNYLEWAFHERQAGNLAKAAEVIIRHHRDIVDNLQMEDLSNLLAEFQAADVPVELWVQLKLIAGDVAEKLQALEVAIEEYGKALGAKDLKVQADAYCRRAKALRFTNLDEALKHYTLCIQLLENATAHPPLLAQAYMGAAWILCDQRPNYPQAQAYLERAQQLVDAQDRVAWAQLHNTWGEWAYHTDQPDRAIEHLLESWVAASAAQNAEFMLLAAHNLGSIYTFAGRPMQGQPYLEKSLALAQQAHDRKVEGLTHNAFGACRFMQGDYTAAIEHYRLARAIFVEMGNHDWQVGNAFNLAEAYAALGELVTARPYFAEGRAAAESGQLQRYLRDFDQLAERYPELLRLPLTLTARQQQIVDFVRTHGAITTPDCITLAGLAERQAGRELNKLVELGVFQREGKTKGARYVLAPGLRGGL